MLKTRMLPFTLFSMMILLACCKSPQEKALSRIHDLEEDLWSDTAGMIDQVKADALIMAYLDYPGKFPQDSSAPTYLLKAGELMMSMRNPQQAVEVFQRVRSTYPTHPRAADALFVEAFVTENDLRNIDVARELYTEFIQNYPAHPLAGDAKICLMHLGKTPEQVIREFEERQALEAQNEPGIK